MAHQPIRIHVRAARVTRILFGCALLTAVLSTAGQLFKYVGGHHRVFGLVDAFDPNGEGNVQTFVSSTLHLLAAALAGVVATGAYRERARFRIHWALLSTGLLYLAVDEAAQLHELLNEPMRDLLGERATGILYLAWVVPAALAALVVGLFFIPFLRQLPGPTRRRFAVAAAVFLGGAIGGEFAGGAYAEAYGFENLTWNLIGVVEEALEMSGAILFVRTLLIHLAGVPDVVEFRFSAGAAGARLDVGPMQVAAGEPSPSGPASR